ncbi:hypothetical protein EO95_15655 [Methanosarcina sp. 1.H.T.1A.1]|uniref:hypothetical protein n=1 Tax=Methanosarcina sp. 1.H.T.1A.1 TaxID=1483602 RepID=UPI0006213EA7|nr:hypothetical protein [Methanosarcina sp. 1.H.T.1A.1]KKH95344.1 hypothetical protein EO95_15655 [Methanosarcina sp. 1.H.T.1A.1]
MSETETMKTLEGLQLKILNNTGEDFVLQAQKIEKGKYKKGHFAPEKIGSYEEKTFELIACEGSCEGGADIEGWIKYGIGCSEGYFKVHFKHMGKEDKVNYSCESHMHDGKILCETSKDKKNNRIMTWIIGPKA